ncbi:MAG: hypothetical protein PHS88_00255 [Candidatus Omnitrophica bacterium]|nr:hypothetical protein [Candidatus Omnitrophota bacterium]
MTKTFFLIYLALFLFSSADFAYGGAADPRRLKAAKEARAQAALMRAQAAQGQLSPEMVAAYQAQAQGGPSTGGAATAQKPGTYESRVSGLPKPSASSKFQMTPAKPAQKQSSFPVAKTSSAPVTVSAAPKVTVVSPSPAKPSESTEPSPSKTQQVIVIPRSAGSPAGSGAGTPTQAVQPVTPKTIVSASSPATAAKPIPVPKPVSPPTSSAPDIAKAVQQMKVTSTNWGRIQSQETKTAIAGYFIAEYKRRGVMIKNTPEYYAGAIDEMTRQNPDFLSQPFDKLLRFVSVIDYDYDNGQDKDQMVLQFLGPEGAKRNRQRLGLE